MEIKFNLNSKETEAFLRYIGDSNKDPKNIGKDIVIRELRSKGFFGTSAEQTRDKKTAFLTIKGSYDIGIAALDQYNLRQNIEHLLTSILNLCFSLEISFKSILNMERIDYENTHNLNVLFSKLPKDIIDNTSNYVIEQITALGFKGVSNRNEFFRNLKLHSNLYNNLRYFELDGKKLEFGANFIITLADYIIPIVLNLIDNKFEYDHEPKIKLKINKVRKLKNFTFDQLQKELQITKELLYLYETNKKTPDLELIVKIGKVLNVPIDLLIDKDV